MIVVELGFYRYFLDASLFCINACKTGSRVSLPGVPGCGCGCASDRAHYPSEMATFGGEK